MISGWDALAAARSSSESCPAARQQRAAVKTRRTAIRDTTLVTLPSTKGIETPRPGHRVGSDRREGMSTRSFLGQRPVDKKAITPLGSYQAFRSTSTLGVNFVAEVGTDEFVSLLLKHHFSNITARTLEPGVGPRRHGAVYGPRRSRRAPLTTPAPCVGRRCAAYWIVDPED